MTDSVQKRQCIDQHELDLMELFPILAIVGWRGMKDKALLEETLGSWVAQHGLPRAVVSGGAAGADRLGETWAKERGIQVKLFRPRWRSTTGVYDRSAGLRRNTDIVNACTHLVAFPSESRGSGTHDSIRKAERAGKPVTMVNLG